VRCATLEFESRLRLSLVPSLSPKSAEDFGMTNMVFITGRDQVRRYSTMAVFLLFLGEPPGALDQLAVTLRVAILLDREVFGPGLVFWMLRLRVFSQGSQLSIRIRDR
jgi:hypothetical protein